MTPNPAALSHAFPLGSEYAEDGASVGFPRGAALGAGRTRSAGEREAHERRSGPGRWASGTSPTAMAIWLPSRLTRLTTLLRSGTMRSLCNFPSSEPPELR